MRRNRHVSSNGKALRQADEPLKTCVDEALRLMWETGGEGLLNWLLEQRPASRKKNRRALDALINYVQPRLDRMDYPTYRAQDWPIGSGTIESTGK